MNCNLRCMGIPMVFYNMRPNVLLIGHLIFSIPPCTSYIGIFHAKGFSPMWTLSWATDISGINLSRTVTKEKHRHEACFVCAKCRASLVDKQFGSKSVSALRLSLRSSNGSEKQYSNPISDIWVSRYPESPLTHQTFDFDKFVIMHSYYVLSQTQPILPLPHQVPNHHPIPP